MITVAITIALLAIAGYPIGKRIDPSLHVGSSIGIGFMVGCGLLTLVMMAFSVVGLRWSFFAVLIVLAVIVAGVVRSLKMSGSAAPVTSRRGAAATVFDAGTALSLAGYAFFATVARPWEWDFWAIWGLKARVFFVNRGIDVGFLSNPDVYYSHPDYPPLLPLVYDFSALMRGEWDDRWLGLLFVATSVALLLVIRDEVRRATGSNLYSAIATFALSGAVCTPWVGLGDGPLVAFGTAGLLVLTRGVREDDRRAVLLSGVLLGVAAMTKNEGLALVVAAAIALMIFRRSRIVTFLVPAAVLSGPWLIWRASMDLETDVIAGGVLSRVADRLSDPVAFMSALASGTPDRGVFWLILIVLLLAGWREIVRRQGVMVIAVLIQAVCYVGIYAGTVHDLASHVQSSMGRISGHLAVAVGAICALAIWDLLLRDSFDSKALSGNTASIQKEEITDVES